MPTGLRSYILLVASIALDAVIVLLLLFLPRSGLEQLAAFYVLLPLCVLRLALAVTALIVAARSRRWPLGMYTMAAMALLAGLMYLYSAVGPSYEPLHKALAVEARALKTQAADRSDRRAYDRQRRAQLAADPAHAELCDLLTERQDLQALQRQNLESVNTPCASYYDDTVSPLLHLILHTYGPWDGGALVRTNADETFVAPAAEQLLAAGADPNARDRFGSTPLHYALIFRNEALVDLLLERGACVLLRNSLEESPLSTHSSPRMNKKIRAASNDPAMLDRCPSALRSDETQERPAVAQDRAPSPDAGMLSALRSGRLERAIAYLESGANPNAQDREGSSFDAALRNCRDNHLTMVQLLLDAGADINQQNRRGETALLIALQHCIEAMPYLLDRGADPTIGNKRGNTALHELVRISPERIDSTLAALLKAGAVIDQPNGAGQTPLIRAALASATRTQITHALLVHGADPNRQDTRGNTAVHVLAQRKADKAAPTVVRQLLDAHASLEIRNRKEQTPLIAALDHGSPEMVKLLIEAGADVHARRKRGAPLISSLISCEPQKLAKLKVLVNAGVDTSVGVKHGALPLALAFYNNLFLECLEPARVLLEAGADPNQRDQNGAAAVHAIATWSEKDPAAALALLKQHGGDIDRRNQQGMTALLLAAKRGASTQVLERLIEHGADPTATNQAGETALDIARKAKNVALISLLEPVTAGQ